MPFNPTGWTSYKVVTVANSGAAVTAYQVRLQLLSVDVDFTLWRSDGHDIRITTGDGVTELPHWRRTWDSTNSLGEVWFKGDLAATGNTTFRLYYGNSGASDASSYASTMQYLDNADAACISAFRFTEGTGTPVDSGPTPYTATLEGSPTWVGSNIAGWGPLSSTGLTSENALDMTGASQAMRIASLLDTFPTDAYSIEMVFVWAGAPNTANGRIFSKYTAGDPLYYGLDVFYQNSVDKLTFRTASSSGPHDLNCEVFEESLAQFVPDKAYRIVVQQSTTHGKEMWLNGSLVGKDASATTMPANGTNSPFCIGALRYDGGTSNHAEIKCQEFRVLSRWQTRNEIVANFTRRKWWSGVNTQTDRLTRYASNPILQGGGGSTWDRDSAVEPAPYFDGTNWNVLYGGYGASAYAGLGLATAPAATGPYTKYAGNPVLGQGGSGLSTSVAHAGLYEEGGTFTLLFSDAIGATANLKRATSTDLITWTVSGTNAIANNANANFIGWANPKVLKVGSTYHLQVEGRNAAGTHWQTAHATNTSISNDGGWTFSPATASSTLDMYGIGNFSHVDPHAIGSKYHAWLHLSALGSASYPDVPSVIVHAVSADLKNWLPDYFNCIVWDLNNGDPLTVGGLNVDQPATDPRVIEQGGNTYLFYDYNGNVGGYEAASSVASYGGTLANFVIDNPSIASVEDPSFDTSGALEAQAATVAGTAAHLTLHTTTGALEAQAATVAGAAVHPHTTTGALEAGAAVVSGSADHALPGGAFDAFDATGALEAGAATVSGTSAHLTLHATSGALAADAAAVSGAAAHLGLHTTTGALVAGEAAISGEISLNGAVPEEDDETLGGRRRRRKRRPTMVGTPYTHDDYVQWVVRTVAAVAASGALDA